MNPSEYATIAQHIRANLGLALDLAEVLLKVRRELIAEGITEIKRILTAESELGELLVDESYTSDPLAKGAVLSVHHRSWAPGVTANLASESNGARNVFVGLAFESPAAVPVGLIEALNHEIRSGLTWGNQWKWWYWLENEYRHWDNKQAVLAFGEGEAPKVLAAQLQALIRVAHPFLDTGTS